MMTSATNPYYLYPRPTDACLDLSSDWRLTWSDKRLEGPESLDSLFDWIEVARPSSVHTSLHRAGRLPHPYLGLNSQQYSWVDKKVWYYQKEFLTPSLGEEEWAFLSFEGIDYFAKVWLNGQLLGTHEGMFGGPEFEVRRLLKPVNQQNHLVVEVLAGNYYMGKDEAGQEQKGITTNAFLDNARRVIKPWSLAGGYAHDMFYVLGLWQGCRLDIVPHTHLERPFLTTLTLGEGQATLRLKAEVLVGKHSLEGEVHPWENKMLSHELPATRFADRQLVLQVRMKAPGQTLEYQFPLDVFEGRNWVEKDFVVENPQLWWPNGLGQAVSYQVELTLTENNRSLDRIDFVAGIRTVAWVRSAGPIVNERWIDWQCVVNGQKLFLKGANWMCADLLLDLPEEKYEWALGLAQNMGTQILRVWGAGLQETDTFYRLCNEKGLMVWQDFTMNSATSNKWPQDIWEAQILHTVFRVRNHPSLVAWCSGNETNPYSETNAQAIGIMERNLRIFDPDRAFFRTSPDHGSIHPYPTWDPAWYRQKFPFVPFLAESGCFGLANASTIRHIIDEGELQDLQNLEQEDYRATHPAVINHFAELNPINIRKLLSRASHFDDVSHIQLERFCESNMAASAEFYQLMSESAQSLFPVTTGLLCWVFKRSWPVFAANQVVDGNDLPVEAYYAMKRTFEPVHVCLALDYLLWKPGDTMRLRAQVISSRAKPLAHHRIRIRLWDDELNLLDENAQAVSCEAGPSVTTLEAPSFLIPSDYRERFFLAVVELFDDAGHLVSRSVYYPRTIALLDDPAENAQYKAFEKPDWPLLSQGPWLKPRLAQGPQAELAVEVGPWVSTPSTGTMQVTITNKGSVPAVHVHVDIEGVSAFFATDNDFWLDAGEQKTLTMTCKAPEDTKRVRTTVQVWNCVKKLSSNVTVKAF